MRFVLGTLAFALALSAFTCTTVAAEEKQPRAEPIKVLMITGGCCHDYERQKKILSEGIAQRANVEFTIVHEGGNSTKHKVSIHEDRDWAKGYDVVVHNECFAAVTDVEFIHNVTEVHKAGVPAVLIHCAMHCYRGKTPEWFNLCGVTSRNHGAKHPITVEVIERGHPVFKGLQPRWKTPQGELYNIMATGKNTTPLANGYAASPEKTNMCVWTNTYGKARVFGTTLGHHNETMQEEVYLDMIARGLLWAVDKLDDDGQPKPGYEGTGVVEKPVDEGPQPTPAEK